MRLELWAQDAHAEHAVSVGFQPGEAKHLRVDGAPVERLTDSEARPLVSVFLPDRLELVSGAPALRRGHLDQVDRRPVACARRNAPRLLGGARAAQRARRGRARRSRLARLAAGLGRRARAPRPGADARPRRARRAPAAALRRARGGARARRGVRRSPTGRARRARLGRGARGRARRAHAVGPRARLHRPRAAPRRAGVPARAGATCAPTARAASSASRCSRCCSPSARSSPPAAATPPLMLLDDVMSELDGGRRERLVAVLRAGGQSVLTTTDLGHVPGRRVRRRGASRRSPTAPCCRPRERRRRREAAPGPRPRRRRARRADRAASAAHAAGRDPARVARGRGPVRGRRDPVRRARRARSTIACPQAVWAQELDLMAERVVERLNEELGRSAVRRLRVQARPVPLPAPKGLIAAGRRAEFARFAALLAQSTRQGSDTPCGRLMGPWKVTPRQRRRPSRAGASRVFETEARWRTKSTSPAAARLRRRGHHRPRGSRGRAPAPGHVHRLDRPPRPASPGLRGRRQLGRRGARRLLRRRRGHDPPGQLGHGGRQRPRHPRRDDGEGGPAGRRGRADRPARRRQVRRRAATRSRAACTASASRSSTRCRSN